MRIPRRRFLQLIAAVARVLAVISLISGLLPMAASGPDVPTFRDAGYDVEGSGWYGTFAPAKTPTAVVDRYMMAAAAVRVPQIAERLRGFGLQPTGTSPVQLAAIQKSDSQ
jgi:tripartite-type tricarboxylate transporter receptor subunit TctC